MRVHASKLRRHKHDPVPTRAFRRELDRLVRTEAKQPYVEVGKQRMLPLTREFLTHIRVEVQRRFTK